MKTTDQMKVSDGSPVRQRARLVEDHLPSGKYFVKVKTINSVDVLFMVDECEKPCYLTSDGEIVVLIRQ
jgi:hypothetical protein